MGLIRYGFGFGGRQFSIIECANSNGNPDIPALEFGKYRNILYLFAAIIVETIHSTVQTMKLIIPMAGRGTRLRPHTHTTPKPLLPIAGKMLIERIVETFTTSMENKITEISFVLGDFGQETESRLQKMAEGFGAECRIFYQDKALGTAHAVYCAEEALDGEVIVAFADTLFTVGSKISTENADSVIWLKKVPNPSSFGVAVMEDGKITRFVEKPSEPVSDLAIIGVYYFRKGEDLRRELADIVNNDKKSARGEYELTDAITALLDQGNVFLPATVDHWLDCGTIQSWIDTTTHVLHAEPTPTEKIGYAGTKIIPPVHIGRDVILENSEIGPNVSLEDGVEISGSRIVNSIINSNTKVISSSLSNSTVGSHVVIRGFNGKIHTGDHSRIG